MTKINAYILIFTSSFFFSSFISAQSCFENLGEASGFDISSYSADLNSAACELIETLPEEYQTKFKVFDFGYYLLNEKMSSGLEGVWEDVKLQASSKSEYYLLIGKISGQDGIYTSFLVDLKFPPVINEECANNIDLQISQIRTILEQTSSPFDYANKEIEAMQTLHTVAACEICGDLIDNDGDGFVDCDDFDCLYLQLEGGGADLNNGIKKNADGCIILTLEQKEIFYQNQDYIVALNLESSDAVLEEIAALNAAQCIGGAIMSVFLEYTVHWFTLNIGSDEYHPYFNLGTVQLVFQQHGLSVFINAASACVESCIPLYPSRIKQAMKNAGVGFVTGIIEATAIQYNELLQAGCSDEEIIFEEMDWAQVFIKAGTQAVISTIVGDLAPRLATKISAAYTANKAKLVDKITEGLGWPIWHGIKKKFISESTNVIEDLVRTIRLHFKSNDIIDKWGTFLDDFGGDVISLQWFNGELAKRVNAWKGLFNTGVRTDIPWLTRARKWLDEGAEFAADGTGKLTKNGEDILQIKNDKILPDKFDFDPSTQKPKPGGTAIGEPSNGYQVYKHGDDLSVRRLPSEAGISPSNISTLNGGGKGHCLHRHGADVTDDALKKRAAEGRAPDGSARTRNNDTETYIPPKSSKFNSPEKVNEALTEVGPGSSKYNAAKSAAESSGANSFPVNHDFGAGSNMGKAYQIPGSQGWHPTSSLPLSGTPQELSGLTKVKAIFVRDGPGDPWYLLTMYPD